MKKYRGSRRKRIPNETQKSEEEFPERALTKIELLFNEPIDRKHLESAISYLRHKVNRRKLGRSKIEHCVYRDRLCTAKASKNTGLKARNYQYISAELRKTVLIHDWDSAASLLLLLLGEGPHNFTAMIVKTCLVILFNHPSATTELVIDLIRNTTGYLVDMDIEDFVLLIFTIRKTLLPPQAIGKYVRKSSIRKVTQDPLYTQFQTFKSCDDPFQEATTDGYY